MSNSLLCNIIIIQEHSYTSSKLTRPVQSVYKLYYTFYSNKNYFHQEKKHIYEIFEQQFSQCFLQQKKYNL